MEHATRTVAMDDAVRIVAPDEALAEVFAEHQAPLVRLAVLLGADDPEDIVAEAFYQLFRRWGRLRDQDAAVAYVRSAVCNLARMRIRHLQVARRHAAKAAHEPEVTSSIEAEAMLRADQRTLIEALNGLSSRQREALVLRYWLDLREAEIAAAMGISAGAVKVHLSRGMASLTRKLEEQK